MIWPTLKLSRIADVYRKILDELGYLPIDKRGADLMFQVVAARYESGSIVLTTSRAHARLGQDLRRGQYLGHRRDRPADAPWVGARHPWRQLSHERQRRPGVISLPAWLGAQ